MPVRVRTIRAAPGAPKRFNLARGWLFFPLLAVLLVMFAVLWRAGEWLVRADDFTRVRWAVVLDGQSRDCERTSAAIDLFRQGRADTLLLSAARIFGNRYAGEFLIPDMMIQGVPRDNIFELRHDAYSTLDEAELLIGQFRLLGLDTVLLITSNYHTARSSFIFNHLADGHPRFLAYPAAYDVYDPQAWWSNRQSRKIFLLESLKFITTLVEVYWHGSGLPAGASAVAISITPDIGFAGRASGKRLELQENESEADMPPGPEQEP